MNKIIGYVMIALSAVTFSPVYGWAIGYDFTHMTMGRGFMLTMISSILCVAAIPFIGEW